MPSIASTLSLAGTHVLSKPSMSLKVLPELAVESVNRVISYQSVKTPLQLRSEIPLDFKAAAVIDSARKACAEIIAGRDNRLIVIVGPCSIHNPEQALDYAHKLRSVTDSFPDLLIIMRSYFEKPRTTVGWKGLINDPNLDGTNQINHGLTISRKLLHDLTCLGLPVAVEVLDTISPQYLSDLISWGAIGARTTESQLHREISSGLPHPIGFKNATDGSATVAVQALLSASSSHAFLGIDGTGQTSIINTTGNNDVHVILRGGNSGPNYSSVHVQKTKETMIKSRKDVHPAIMVDCSHGNSEKNHRNQSKVIKSICDQLIEGETSLVGVMIESNIHEGRQDLTSQGSSALKYGVSITDACVGFETTIEMLAELQLAVIARKKQVLYNQSTPITIVQ